MIIVADSGSTKTDWAIVGDEVRRVQSIGLNPFFFTDEVFGADDVRRPQNGRCRPGARYLFLTVPVAGLNPTRNCSARLLPQVLPEKLTK